MSIGSCLKYNIYYSYHLEDTCSMYVGVFEYMQTGMREGWTGS